MHREGTKASAQWKTGHFCVVIVITGAHHVRLSNRCLFAKLSAQSIINLSDSKNLTNYTSVPLGPPIPFAFLELPAQACAPIRCFRHPSSLFEMTSWWHKTQRPMFAAAGFTTKNSRL